MTHSWATRSEQIMLRQQLGRLRAFGEIDETSPPTLRAERDKQRGVVEGSRRPGWIRRHGWHIG